MLTHLLCNIIEMEYDRNCCAQIDKTKRISEYGRSKYGLEIELAMYGDLVATILIYGEMNYKGVYVWLRHRTITGLPVWECQGYHDSCWRNSLESWIVKNEKQISYIHHYPFKREEGWYKIVEFSDFEIEELRKSRKNKYGNN